MKVSTRPPTTHRPGFWSEAPCLGCKKPLGTPDETQRLCQDCHEALLEGLAAKIDPAYDPQHLNEGPDCWRVLYRLYTRWDWNAPGLLVPEPD
jgi:hypothetical protein